MKCPKCNIEARIDKSENVIRDNKLFRRMHYVCRNAECNDFNVEIKVEDVPCKVVVEEGEQA